MVELEHETDVVVSERCQFVGGVGGDVLPVVPDFSAVRSVQRPQDVQQGAFAGSACPHDGDDFVLRDGQVDAFEHFQIAVALFYVFDFNHISSMNFRGTKIQLISGNTGQKVEKSLNVLLMNCLWRQTPIFCMAILHFKSV